MLEEFRDRKANGYGIGEYRRVLYEEEIWNAVLLFVEKRMPYKVLEEKRSQDFKHIWKKRFVKKGGQKEKSIGQQRTYAQAKDVKKGYHYLWDGLKESQCIQKDEALQTFESQKKANCFIHFPVIDLTVLVRRADLLTLEAIEEMTDVVIADENLEWTFVKTHEKGIGPYFVS